MTRTARISCLVAPAFFASVRGAEVFSGGHPCQVVGNCTMSPNYPRSYSNGQSCDIEIKQTGVLVTESFHTESCCDHLQVGGKSYEGSLGPRNVFVAPGQRIAWRSDYSNVETGWKLCLHTLPPENVEPIPPQNSPSVGLTCKLGCDHVRMVGSPSGYVIGSSSMQGIAQLVANGAFQLNVWKCTCASCVKVDGSPVDRSLMVGEGQHDIFATDGCVWSATILPTVGGCSSMSEGFDVGCSAANLPPVVSTCNGDDGGCGGHLGLGDGDCNSDSQCQRGLKCGSDNCGDFRDDAGWPSASTSGWDTTDDCCYSESDSRSFHSGDLRDATRCMNECRTRASDTLDSYCCFFGFQQSKLGCYLFAGGTVERSGSAMGRAATCDPQVPVVAPGAESLVALEIGMAALAEITQKTTSPGVVSQSAGAPAKQGTVSGTFLLAAIMVPSSLAAFVVTRVVQWRTSRLEHTGDCHRPLVAA